MRPADREVDYILSDCMLAMGEMFGDDRELEYDAIVWLRDRYRDKFIHALTVAQNAWRDDRSRVLGVSRYLAQRAIAHAGPSARIDRASIIKAADEVESGCQMRARQPRHLR